MRLRTVRVVHPGDPSKFMTINESDLADEHELWPDQIDQDDVPGAQAEPDEASVALRCMGKLVAQKEGISFASWLAQPAADRLAKLAEAEREIDEAMSRREMPRVTKGPGGKWFVKRGKETVAGGFDTEAEAQAALDA